MHFERSMRREGWEDRALRFMFTSINGSAETGAVEGDKVDN